MTKEELAAIVCNVINDRDNRVYPAISACEVLAENSNVVALEVDGEAFFIEVQEA